MLLRVQCESGGGEMNAFLRPHTVGKVILFLIIWVTLCRLMHLLGRLTVRAHSVPLLELAFVVQARLQKAVSSHCCSQLRHC